MLLNEVLQSPVEWKVTNQIVDAFEAIFHLNTNQGPSKFGFNAFVDSDDGTTWTISFHQWIKGRDVYNITKTGSELIVFSTIIDIMRAFIKKYKPQLMYFGAEEPSRMKLYLKLIRTLLPNWYVFHGESEIWVSVHPFD